ncbi:MAG: peptidylprolyl isomerase [Oceanospirillaceae bacterium]|nr:peptidylprolyl isomerase [Oceanospirillaceae bacterium]
MKIAKDIYVEFHYSLVDDSEVKDGSRGDEPLSYIHGHNMLVPGLEQAMEGRAEGDQFQVEVPPELGYGQRDEELFEIVPREAFAELPGLKKGMLVNLEDGEGEPQLGRVVDLDIREVKIDLNHPFAGQTLLFDVEVLNVRQPTDAEIAELQSEQES